MNGDAEVTDGMKPNGRRLVLRGAVGVAIAATGGLSARLLSSPGAGYKRDALQLSSHVQPNMDSLEISVDEAGIQTPGPRRWRSDKLTATSFTMVGFVWANGSSSAPRVQVRTKASGQWTNWWPLPDAHEPPSAEQGTLSDHTGTELVWVGLSEGIQFHIAGVIPAGMKLVLLYPKRLPSDRSIPSVTAGNDLLAGTLLRGTTGATQRLRPAILSRTDWAADESWRDGSPRYNLALRQIHVHHTAGRNDYLASDVPGIIRGMYRYHTHNLGWSDLAYNFLVDRFGRVWEGRAGGVGRRVRGAHTRGFNAESTGVAAIGNFDITTPNTATLRAIAQVAAWKLNRWRGDPLGSVAVTSEGSDRYSVGEQISLPVIDGHRDTNLTACPGGYLYAALPVIRRRAKYLMVEAAKTPIVVLQPGVVLGKPIVGLTLAARPGQFDAPDATFSYAWTRNSIEIPGATRRKYICSTADFRARIAVRVTASDPKRLPVTQVLTVDKTVKARPKMRVNVKVVGRRAKVTVVVAPPSGISAVPSGQVVIRVGRRKASRPTADGVVTLRLRRLAPGRTRVKVTCKSDNGFKVARLETFVRIGAKRFP